MSYKFFITFFFFAYFLPQETNNYKIKKNIFCMIIIIQVLWYIHTLFNMHLDIKLHASRIHEHLVFFFIHIITYPALFKKCIYVLKFHNNNYFFFVHVLYYLLYSFSWNVWLSHKWCELFFFYQKFLNKKNSVSKNYYQLFFSQFFPIVQFYVSTKIHI